jgi:2-dehydro-3-deoxygalactonokinase
VKTSQFLSCDWGTSSFRLRLIESASLKTLQEIRTADGVRAIFEKGGDRAKNFAEYLLQKLNETSVKNEAPLVISGMASSTIGWKELPYAKAPFALDGRGLEVEALNWEGPPTFLVSGVATETEIMRGEETQAIGILADPQCTKYRQGCRLILPGTHSKHLNIRDNRVLDFKTYLTGELFEVLSKHSILRATIEPGGTHDPIAFAEGVSEASEGDLLGKLFRARTRSVLSGASAAGNASFLSGLLIGSELLGVARDTSAPVLIAAAGSLADLYHAAMKILAPIELKWMSLPGEALEQATIRAHALILEHQLS